MFQIGRVRAERLALEYETLTSDQNNLDSDTLAAVANAMEEIVKYTSQDDQVRPLNTIQIEFTSL